MNFRILLLCAIVASGGAAALGQDAAKSSLAGEASAHGAKKGVEDTQYNLKVGPVLINLQAESDIELNDNINLAEQGRQSDMILRPSVNVNARWPVTTLNTLTLDTTLGYSKYINHPENDTKYLLASPDSALEFVMYIDDFRLNFHDRFAYQQDPIAVSVLSNTSQYGRFTNSAGLTVDWDLNDVVLTMGCDYNTFLATTSQFSYLDSSGSTLTARATFTVNPTIKAGLQAVSTFTEYNQNVQNSNNMTSIGPFVEAQLTTNMKINGSVGAQIGLFNQGGTNGDNSNLGSIYANAMFDHRINQYLSQTIEVGHSAELGLTSNFYTTDYIRHHANWNIINHVSLGTQVFFEHVTESGGFANETFNRYGGGISVGYQITQKLTATLGYTYTQKDSSAFLRDYYQNSIVLSLGYKF